MKTEIRNFVIAFVVFLFFMAIIIFIPMPDSIKGYLSISGILGFSSIILKDYITQYQKNQHDFELQKINHINDLEIERLRLNTSLTINSHMSDLIFDKQVSFCEEYYRKMQEIANILMFKGPELDLTTAQELTRIRRKYSPWLTDSIDENLLPLERSIREIAATSQVLPNLPVGPQRTTIVEKNMELFARLIEYNIIDKIPTAEDTLFAATSHLRKLININEFTNIRQKTVTD
jgi:hypothetical protein